MKFLDLVIAASSLKQLEISSKGEYELLQKANKQLTEGLIMIATWKKRNDHHKFKSYNFIELPDDNYFCKIMHNSKCDGREPSL